MASELNPPLPPPPLPWMHQAVQEIFAHKVTSVTALDYIEWHEKRAAAIIAFHAPPALPNGSEERLRVALSRIADDALFLTWKEHRAIARAALAAHPPAVAVAERK